MNSPQTEKMDFLSTHPLACLMTSCAKYKGQSHFSKMEPYFSSTLDEATSLFQYSCRVTACTGPNETGDRSRRLHLPL